MVMQNVLVRLILAGKDEEALTYIENHADEINIRDETSKLTPLEAAAQEGQFLVLVALLNHSNFWLSEAQQGKQVTETIIDVLDEKHGDDEDNKEQVIPVFENAADLAVKCENSQCVLLLEACGIKLKHPLTRRANIPLLTPDHIMAILYQAITHDKSLLFAKVINMLNHLLIGNNLRQEINKILPTLFLFAIQKGRLAIVKRLFDLETNLLDQLPDHLFFEPLKLAIRFQYVDIFNYLRLTCYPSDPFNEFCHSCSAEQYNFISQHTPSDQLKALYQLTEEPSSKPLRPHRRVTEYKIEDEKLKIAYKAAYYQDDKAFYEFIEREKESSRKVTHFRLLCICLEKHDFATFSYVYAKYSSEEKKELFFMMNNYEHHQLLAILRFELIDSYTLAMQLLNANKVEELDTFLKIFYSEKAFFWRMFAREADKDFLQFIFSKKIHDVKLKPQTKIQQQLFFTKLPPDFQEKIKKRLFEFCKTREFFHLPKKGKQQLTEKTPLLQAMPVPTLQLTPLEENLFTLFMIPHAPSRSLKIEGKFCSHEGNLFFMRPDSHSKVSTETELFLFYDDKCNQFKYWFRKGKDIASLEHVIKAGNGEDEIKPEYFNCIKEMFDPKNNLLDQKLDWNHLRFKKTREEQRKDKIIKIIEEEALTEMKACRTLFKITSRRGHTQGSSDHSGKVARNIEQAFNAPHFGRYFTNTVVSYLNGREDIARLARTCTFFSSSTENNSILLSTIKEIDSCLTALTAESQKRQDYGCGRWDKLLSIGLGLLSSGLAMGSGLFTAHNLKYAELALEFCSDCIKTTKPRRPSGWFKCHGLDDPNDHYKSLSVSQSCKNNSYDCAGTCDQISDAAPGMGVPGIFLFMLFLVSCCLWYCGNSGNSEKFFTRFTFENIPTSLKSQIDSIYRKNNMPLPDPVTLLSEIRDDLKQRREEINNLLLKKQPVSSSAPAPTFDPIQVSTSYSINSL